MEESVSPVEVETMPFFAFDGTSPNPVSDTLLCSDK